MAARASQSALAALALIALTASLASAAGVNLFWNDCGAGGNGQSNMSFACNTNDGTFDLYLSVDPPPGVEHTNGHNHFLDLQSASSPLPAWWDVGTYPITCRPLSLAASGDFSTGTSGGLDCPDPWSGNGNAGIAAYTPNWQGNPSRVSIIGSIAIGSEGWGVAMPPGIEYYSIRFRINARKTMGTPACAGCLDPVCVVLTQVRIAQTVAGSTGARDIAVTGTIAGGRNWVTWQGGAVDGAGCPAAETVPTQNATWGRVKSLYR